MAMSTLSGSLKKQINDACEKAFVLHMKEGMSAKCDEFCAKLEEEGMAYHAPQWIHGVAAHADNRGGVGLEPTGVWKLIELHAPRGWSWNQVSAARAVEMPPGRDGDRHRAKNEEIARQSNGLIPEVRGQELSIVALTKTHTSSTLRAIDRQSAPPKEIPFWRELVQEDGRLSKEKFLEKYPSYIDPVRNGLNWLVIKHEVMQDCPRFAEYVMEAGNLDHDTTTRETTFQLMNDCHRKLIAGLTDEQICKDVAAFRPQMKNMVSHLTKFVGKWGGGKDAKFLREIDDFKIHLPYCRDIDPKQIGMLADARLSDLPEWPASCVMALLSAPESYLQRGSDRANLFDPTDVIKMGTAGATGVKDLVVQHSIPTKMLNVAKQYVPML